MEPGTIIRPEEIDPLDSQRALSPTLERWLLKHLQRPDMYRVDAVIAGVPPETLSELLDDTRGTVGFAEPYGGTIQEDGKAYGQRIPVSGAHSEDTIWSSPKVNALFRAWHDSLHILHAAEMDWDGEQLVARAHQSEARRFGLDRADRELLRIETYGQSRFHHEHGMFPDAQRLFAMIAQAQGLEAALATPDTFADHAARLIADSEGHATRILQEDSDGPEA